MYAELVDVMGTDLSVVNAARVSFDKTSDWVNTEEIARVGATPILDVSDTKLIQYLAKHNHWTPFAHTSICMRLGAPVPIRTQCFKHKAGFVENEESRRYISSRPVLFVPDEFRSKPTNGIKQGSSGVHPHSEAFRNYYKRIGEECIEAYEHLIAQGVCPEQARFILPQGVEVNWIWTGNLYSYANFYNKRTDPNAQKEIRDLATEVGKIIEPLFPVSWLALTSNA